MGSGNPTETRESTGSKKTGDGACHSVVGGDNAEIQQERYRVFIEDVEDGFYETNLKGDFLFFNDALCRIFGYAREDIQHRNDKDFMDQSNAAQAYERFNQIFTNGKGFTDIIWEIIRKDGRRRVALPAVFPEIPCQKNWEALFRMFSICQPHERRPDDETLFR